ncbi:MAG: phosphoribosyltransferase family protein [Planctomycetota bacterium]|nr:phosphoribosyltransferase family protein [Planctomycetota bacterium]
MERETQGLCARLAALGEIALQILYPPRCAGCEASLFGLAPAPLCADCAARVQLLDDRACVFCNAPAGAYAALGADCERCRHRDLAFTRAAAVAVYAPPVREVIHAFKFKGLTAAGETMAAMMAERCRAARFPRQIDAVVPVPLHRQRLRERGYNQAEILARGVARRLPAPLRLDILIRSRYTPAQALLPHIQRLGNPGGAFAARASFVGATLLLVDDVMTTGATLSACARALRAAGARRVYALVFARG